MTGTSVKNGTDIRVRPDLGHCFRVAQARHHSAQEQRAFVTLPNAGDELQNNGGQDEQT